MKAIVVKIMAKLNVDTADEVIDDLIECLEKLKEEKLKEKSFYELYKGEEPPREKAVHWIKWHMKKYGGNLKEAYTELKK